MSSLKLAVRAQQQPVLRLSPDQQWNVLAEIERDNVLGRLVSNLMTKHGLTVQDAKEVVLTATIRAAKRIENRTDKADIR